MFEFNWTIKIILIFVIQKITIMNTKKPSFLLYRSFYEPIKNLPDEDLGKLFRSIYEYQLSGTIPDTHSSILMAFQFFKNTPKDAKRTRKTFENDGVKKMIRT